VLVEESQRRQALEQIHRPKAVKKGQQDLPWRGGIDRDHAGTPFAGEGCLRKTASSGLSRGRRSPETPIEGGARAWAGTNAAAGSASRKKLSRRDLDCIKIQGKLGGARHLEKT